MSSFNPEAVVTREQEELLDTATPRKSRVSMAAEPRNFVSAREVPLDPRDPVESLRRILEEPAHHITNAWWSPAVFEHKHRRTENWIESAGVALDLDTGVREGHVALSESLREKLWDGLSGLSCNLAHLTPRGLRAIFLYREPCSDPELQRLAQQGAADLILRDLAKLGVTELIPDASATPDISRVLYLPRTVVVKGTSPTDASRRDEPVLTCSPTLFSPEDLAAESMAVRNQEERRGSSSSFEAAKREWCEDHPLELPSGRSRCPECHSDHGFGPLPTDPQRWSCFSSKHSHVGTKVGACHVGDALDLTAAARGVSCRDVLVQDGYLKEFTARTATRRTSAPERKRPILDDAALCGPAGRFVAIVEPQSEAAAALLLAEFLTAFGSVLGRGIRSEGPYFRVGAERHFGNLYVTGVGATVSCKGLSWSHVREFFRALEPEWRIEAGLSSAEGLLQMLAHWPPSTQGTECDADHTTALDRRVLVRTPELASVLRQTERRGNTLTAAVRELWDSGEAGILTRKNALRVTGAHLSLVSDITPDELRKYLTETERANGFANRFLYVWSEMSKLLPTGGHVPESELAKLREVVKGALQCARRVAEVRRDPEAEQLWSKEYEGLRRRPPGLLGAVTARAAPQVVRLSMLYALLDGAPVVKPHHLRAALALWRYCEDSAAFIFGRSCGSPDSDEILRWLRERRGQGLTRTEITSEVFQGNQPRHRIDAALVLLLEQGLACKCVRHGPSGAARELWLASEFAIEEGVS